MNLLIRSTAAAAVLAATLATPALADATKLRMRSGEVTAPSVLAAGEQFLSISKGLKCDGSICSATIKGRAKKQILISQVACLSEVPGAEVSYGAVLRDETAAVVLAIFPVTSRSLKDVTEIGVVGGPAQVVIGPDESVVVGIQATGRVSLALCTLQGTTTKL